MDSVDFIVVLLITILFEKVAEEKKTKIIVVSSI